MQAKIVYLSVAVMLLALSTVPVALADRATMEECVALYQRCRQTLHMQLASGVPSLELDPASRSMELSGFLNTPASVVQISHRILNHDESLEDFLSQYISFESPGNYEACMLIPNAHHCIIPPTSQGGPRLGYCLPQRCSASDYATLAGSCVVDRIVNNTERSTDNLMRVQELIESLNETVWLDDPYLSQDLGELMGLVVDGYPQGFQQNISEVLEALARTRDVRAEDLDRALQAASFIRTSITLNQGFCSRSDLDSLRGLSLSGWMFMAWLFLTILVILTATLVELVVIPFIISQSTQKDFKTFRYGTPEHAALEADPKYGPIARMCQHFSLYRSLHELMTKRVDGPFRALNGVRVFATGYILLGNTFVVFAASSGNAFPALIDFSTSFSAVIVNGGLHAIDTFFFMSGFLATFIMLRFMKWIKPFSFARIEDWMCFARQAAIPIMHRYLRLTPLYAAILWWFASVAPTLGSGPYWWSLRDAVSICHSTWWTNLLYINSVVPCNEPALNSCMGWTWYLSCDFIFHLLTPCVVALYRRSRSWGITLIVSILVQGMATNGYLTHIHDAGITTSDTAYSTYIYGRPWTNSAPYFLGVALAMHLDDIKPSNMQSKTKDKRFQEPVTRSHLIYYTLSALFCVAIVYLLPWDNFRETGIMTKGSWPKLIRTMYNAVDRVVYGIGLCGLCQMLFHGHGWVIRWVLEHPVFDSLAQLTYGVYLWHVGLLFLFDHERRHPSSFRFSQTLWWYMALLLLSYGMSFLSFIIVERPATSLLTAMMQRLWGCSQIKGNKVAATLSGKTQPLLSPTPESNSSSSSSCSPANCRV